MCIADKQAKHSLMVQSIDRLTWCATIQDAVMILRQITLNHRQECRVSSKQQVHKKTVRIVMVMGLNLTNL